MNSDVVVNITNLNKSFGDNHVLRGIDLQVQRGEVVCIIGPSGFLGIVQPHVDLTSEITKGAFPVFVNSKTRIPSDPFSIVP